MFRRRLWGRSYRFDPTNDNQFSDAWVVFAILLTLIGLGLNSIVLTTSAGIMDHEEARRKHVSGKIIGFFY